MIFTTYIAAGRGAAVVALIVKVGAAGAEHGGKRDSGEGKEKWLFHGISWWGWGVAKLVFAE